MGNLVVKDNALIEASHKLGEVEQRLILLAILKARNECETVEQLKGRELIIHADDYAKTFKITQRMAYKALKKAVMGLYRAEWGYKYLTKKGNVAVRYERFTQSAEYVENEGIVKFMFSNAIIPMLVELEKRFTIYAIEQVAKLSSGYAMRLYEFFMQHLDKSGKGWLDISLEDLRFRFGLLPSEYKTMSNFKAYVLDLAIKQINANTDLTASYEQRKRGRIITGFRFDFERKAKPAKSERMRDDKTLDWITGLTDPEINVIRERIEDHIARLEAKGETVDGFHRQNITKKAFDEQWGVADYRAEQERQESLKRHRETQLAQEKAERERKEREKKQCEQRQQAMIDTFERLTPEQQEFILDEVGKRSGGIFAKIFREDRANNAVHKNPMFSGYFYELLDC